MKEHLKNNSPVRLALKKTKNFSEEFPRGSMPPSLILFFPYTSIFSSTNENDLTFLGSIQFPLMMTRSVD